MYSASGFATEDFALNAAFVCVAVFFVDGVVVLVFLLFFRGMDGEDCDCVAISVVWDDDAFLDLLDLVGEDCDDVAISMVWDDDA